MPDPRDRGRPGRRRGFPAGTPPASCGGTSARALRRTTSHPYAGRPARRWRASRTASPPAASPPPPTPHAPAGRRRGSSRFVLGVGDLVAPGGGGAVLSGLLDRHV